MTNKLITLKNATNSKEQSIALELFYGETAHLVFAFCRKKGLGLQDAEDIVQIVYSQIYNKREKYNPAYSSLAWLFIITKSETKDYRKKSAIYADYLNDYGIFLNMSQASSDNPSKVEEADALDLSGLNIKERAALEKRYFAEQKFSEIADSLGLSETNVRKIISRAIQKLKG